MQSSLKVKKVATFFILGVFDLKQMFKFYVLCLLLLNPIHMDWIIIADSSFFMREMGQ